MSETRSAVLWGARKITVESFELPSIGRDDGLLRVEATGVCGADWAPYLGGRQDFFKPPLILGHEIVGRIEALGAEAERRWGVAVGDRVVVEEPLRCGACDACLEGRYQMCGAWRYGSKSIEEPPSLWGGYSQYLYLDPRAVVHPVPDSLSSELATLYVPVSNGLYWVQEVGGARTGSIVVIQGPGQHGLGCVVAAAEAGAQEVVVLGLAADADRLTVARELGATATIMVDQEDAVELLRERTGGKLADVVVNVTEGAPGAIAQAVELTGDRGQVVVAGTSHAPAEGLSTDLIMERELTIRGVRGRYSRSIRAALKIIESSRYPLDLLCTHRFGLEETEKALQTMGGELSRDRIHVVVLP